MSGFDADWLALRAPQDAAAREAASGLVSRFVAAVGEAPLIVDLAAGTGNNLAYLAPRMAGAAWRLVDKEPALLTLAAARGVGAGCETMVADLDDAAWPSVLAGAAGVTTSALLDLVSVAWLDGLVTALAARRLPVLAALTVEARLAWTPGHGDDAAVAAAFWRDMGRDKGFGPALGATAAAALAAALTHHGYDVATAATDWVIDSDSPEMLKAMVGGLADVAARHGVAVEGWRQARLAAVAAGELGLTVGHRDVLGVI